LSNKKTKQKNSTPNAQTNNDSRSKQLLTEGALIGSIALCLIMMVALLSYSPADPGWSKTATNHQVLNAIGPAGALFADILFNLFGAMAFLFPLLLAARALQILRTCLLKEALPFDSVTFSLRMIGFVLVMVSATSLANIQFSDGLTSYPSGFGGVLGKTISESVLEVFSFTGATLFLLSLSFLDYCFC
jgi:S-DNA-T family DNA segregation ATPase FtsK/SpoIIIE